MTFNGSVQIFKTFFNRNPSIMAVTDISTGQFIEVNQSFFNKLGYDQNDVIGKTAEELELFLEPDDQRLAVKELVSNGYIDNVELQVKTKSGGVINGLFFGEIIEDGNDKYLLTVMTDITELKLAEQNRCESEDKYRSLYDNAPLSYQSLDEDGHFLDINPAWLRTLGYEKEEVIGKRFSDFLHIDMVPQFDINFPKFKNRGYVNNIEYKLRHKDGHYVSVLFEGCIGYLPDGSFKQTYCVFKDITEQKIVEDKLHSSLSLQHIVFEAMDEAIHLVDTDLRVLLANKKLNDWSKQLGFGKDPVGLYIQDVFPFLSDKVIDQYKEVLTTGETFNSEETIQIGDKSFTTETRKIPIKDGTKVTSILTIVADITERKNAEMALLKGKIAAENANRTKSDFLANMSHELRTPLNSVLGFSQVMENEMYGELNKEQKRFISIILKSGKHLLGVINQILDISKVESGYMLYSPKIVNFSDILLEIELMIMPLAKKKSINIKINNEFHDLDLFVDSKKLKNILYNLLNNAVKFTHERGNISIETAIIDSLLHVSVSDDGIGIAKEDHDVIFESFKQTDPFLTRQHGGTGLGLALVKKYIEMHGGSIWVESEVGVGSKFTFTIPVNENVQ